MYCSRLGVSNIIVRYARRVSSVHSTPTASNRFWQVPALSSAAMMPLPGATIASAVDLSVSMFMVSKKLHSNVSRINIPYRPGVRGHHDGVCIGIRRTDRNTLHQRSGHYSRCREAQVLASRKIMGAEHCREVGDPCFAETLHMFLIFGLPTADDLAAKAAKCRGDNDSFGAPANTNEDVDGGTALARRDGHRDIAVGEELNARTGGAYFRNDVVVPRPAENSDGNFRYILAKRRRDLPHVL